MKKICLLLAVLFAVTASSQATTWFDKEKECPLCKVKGNYPVIGSYGSYIYHWKSKFQLVYWPRTDGQSLYQCDSCKYSCMMWDFDSIPQEAVSPITKMLDSVKKSVNTRSYMQQYEIAEKVYEILGTDIEIMADLYRTMAYHYVNAKIPEKAKEYRIKSLNITKSFLADTSKSIELKPNTFIVGSMYYFTGNKDSALVYLNKAKKIDFVNPEQPAENSKGYNDYLNEVIDMFIEGINAGKDMEDNGKDE